jgi:hypothetical protein
VTVGPFEVGLSPAAGCCRPGESWRGVRVILSGLDSGERLRGELLPLRPLPFKIGLELSACVCAGACD